MIGSIVCRLPMIISIAQTHLSQTLTVTALFVQAMCLLLTNTSFGIDP